MLANHLKVSLTVSLAGMLVLTGTSVAVEILVGMHFATVITLEAYLVASPPARPVNSSDASTVR